jgi:GH15 family glucan-1,4-alpha-glucosidase
VRIGNAASTQVQLDVDGEVLDAVWHGVAAGVTLSDDTWALVRQLLAWLETGWRRPDAGIWEVRGPRRHFTHSKVMAWVAFDRASRIAARTGRAGPVGRWRAAQAAIRAQVFARGWSAERASFVQAYDLPALDASLLLLPLVGFLPADDPRMLATVAAIRRELETDGLLQRYRTTGPAGDGLPPGEGAFVACSFWLVETLAVQGRQAGAEALFARLLTLRNDVGLVAEEYDPAIGQLGNFPQAFSHLALVTAALALAKQAAPRAMPLGADCAGMW